LIRKNRKKVFVALSGGVDSAVAAALLKKRGFDVSGVFFRFFDAPNSTWKPNFQVGKIAKKLGISLKIVDARKEFRGRVIDCFVDAYKKGLTPNPCVHCNKEVKFHLLFELLKKYKADFVATGHYAQIHITHNIKHITRKKLIYAANYALCEAKDKQKDQSYFLYRLSQRELPRIIFPLGGLEKNEVKKMAKKLKLPVQEGESQDICFLGEKPIEEFLRKKIVLKKGKIRDIGGKILGCHEGLPLYTIGQRKGIRISGTGPYWVVGKNTRKNELVVSNDPKKLLTKRFEVGRVNWINQEIKLPLCAKVQIRYHSERISAIIKKGRSGRLIIETKKPVQAATAGQSAVFCRNSEVLGGGIITTHK
jgi:tRNA-specific 2-thiouridylase